MKSETKFPQPCGINNNGNWQSKKPASRVFSLPYHPDWRVWVIGVIAGTLIVGMSGLLANRRILNTPPVETLRET